MRRARASPPATSSWRSSPALVAGTAGDRALACRGSCCGRSLLCAAFGWAGDRDRLRPRRDLGDVPARHGCAPRCRTACASWSAFLVVSTAVFLVALVVDFGTRGQRDVAAAHRRRRRHRLHRSAPRRWSPTPSLFTGSYLLGPGFRSAPARVVSPAAGRRSARCRCSRCSPRCPTTGPTPAWTAYLLAVPPLVAAVAAARAQRRTPDPALGRGRPARLRRRRARRACCSASSPRVSGGAVGPGRMRDVGPFAFDVLVHAITAFGIGGLLGGLAMTWWQRRRPPRRDADRPRLRPCRPAARRRSSSSCRAPAPTSRRCSTPAPTRRTAPRWSPSAPTATASRAWPAPSAPASRPSCTGSRTSRPARSGTPRWPTPWRRTSPTSWCSAGFMKLVGSDLPRRFGGTVVNTHPALSPSFPGMHGPGDALAYGVKVTGATLFVVDAGVDTGPIVAQAAVPVEDDDTVETPARADQGGRARRCSSTRSAGWPARASRSTVAGSGSGGDRSP